MTGMYGVSAYQQTNRIWNQETKKNAKAEQKSLCHKAQDSTQSVTEEDVKKSTWKPIDTAGPLVPSHKEGIGMAIGDVQLSDGAKKYYNSLKAKFGNMEFIAVSKDMKAQVQANAAAYGNAFKQVVLIDDEKLERMAEDETYRKKYEGIIAMSQTQLTNTKNSLSSSGAAVKNFGMSVASDGTTSFFATLEKAADEQTKRLEKKQAEKRAERAKEKKHAEKKAKEKRLEKAREEKRLKEAAKEDDDREYIKLEADSLEELMNRVTKYAYENSSKTVMTDAEKSVGQNVDLKR